jgi:hypothetical protein
MADSFNVTDLIPAGVILTTSMYKSTTGIEADCRDFTAFIEEDLNYTEMLCEVEQDRRYSFQPAMHNMISAKVESMLENKYCLSSERLPCIGKE